MPLLQIVGHLMRRNLRKAHAQLGGANVLLRVAQVGDDDLISLSSRYVHGKGRPATMRLFG